RRGRRGARSRAGGADRGVVDPGLPPGVVAVLHVEGLQGESPVGEVQPTPRYFAPFSSASSAEVAAWRTLGMGSFSCTARIEGIAAAAAGPNGSSAPRAASRVAIDSDFRAAVRAVTAAVAKGVPGAIRLRARAADAPSLVGTLPAAV